MKIAITIDTESDLHSPTYKSLEKGIPLLLEILEKHNIKATFFTPANLLASAPTYFKQLFEKGHEIAIHGYEHERFDELSKEEKEIRIKKSVEIYEYIFNQTPKGFRAPQHSIDKQTLEILKTNFFYDSSESPFNMLQLFFFPKKLSLGIKSFFSSRRIEKISNDFYEIPPSSMIIPFVSLPLRAFPWPVLKLFLKILQLTHNQLIFYAHSWDFIELPESRIDRTFSHRRLIENLGKTIEYLSKKNEFVKMEEFLNENP